MSAFQAGNIIVYRIGGTTSGAAATYLDEYTSAGVLVQTIALPTTTTGANDALTDSGQATYSGEITESAANGAILAAGYDVATGTASATSSTGPRVVGIVSANGTVDTSTASSGYSGIRVTGAASANGQGIYIATSTGVGYTTADSTAAPVTITSGTVSANQVLTANGQLYYSGTSASTPGIYALGSGLPTTAGQSSTLIAASTKPVAFAFASLGGGATDTLYVADNTNGIEKFSYVNGAYTQTGTVAVTGATGLNVTVTNGTATLYFTTNVTSNGVTTSTLRSLVDSSGFDGTLSGTPTTVATAPTGNVFKGDVVYQPAVCFASGTSIRTTRGDVAVEDLSVGDEIVTSSGVHRPIRWLGHRTVDCRRHPRETMPILVTAHALGENRPSRDLYVSPGHAICLDLVGEVLIPAISLVNGATIRQVEVDEVTYWHVELDSHDVLLAENLACESYLDMGNRGFFAESGVVALDASPDAPVVTHADFCRPFHMDGPLVEVVRGQIGARAKALGWRLEQPGLDDLHLVVDGVRVAPQVRGVVARFPMPAGARDAWLVSPTSIPAAVTDSPDLRALGACLRGLEVDDGFGTSRAIGVDDPRLCVGFHAVEGDGAATWRWTAGRSRLPASLWAEIDGDVVLRVNLAGPMLPRWVAPAREAKGGARAA